MCVVFTKQTTTKTQGFRIKTPLCRHCFPGVYVWGAVKSEMAPKDMEKLYHSYFRLQPDSVSSSVREIKMAAI